MTATETDEKVERLGSLLSGIVYGLVDQPESVEIKNIVTSSLVVFIVRVAKSDLGKILGKQGKNIGAVRTIMQAVSVKERTRIQIEIEE